MQFRAADRMHSAEPGRGKRFRRGTGDAENGWFIGIQKGVYTSWEPDGIGRAMLSFGVLIPPFKSTYSI